MQRDRSRRNLGSRATALAAAAILALTACNDGGLTDAPTTTVVVPAEAWSATACVWRWFDRWDVTIEVPDGVAVGTTFRLRASLFQGDVSSVSATGAFTVDGSGPQVVELHVPPLRWLDPKEIEASRSSGLTPIGGPGCDVAFDDQGDITIIDFLDMTTDVDPPPKDGTPLGDLVAAVDSTDAPMFALAELLWLQPEPAFDRLYLAPDVVLDTITVERDGTCRAITSHYGSVRVTQQHGCAEPLASGESPSWVTVTVPDDHWAVDITGPQTDATALADALQPFDVPNGEAAEGPAILGSDEWLDGYFADHPEIVELARFDWHEGTIAIVGRPDAFPLERYFDPVSYGVNTNYAKTGQGCDEYAIGIASSTLGGGVGLAPPGGFAWFVARDPGTTFTLSTPGLPTTVPLQQAPSGEFVGFLDIGEAPLPGAQIAVTDAAGNPVPCTQ